MERGVRPAYWMDDRGYVVTDKWLQTSPRATSDWRDAYSIPVRKRKSGGYSLACDYCGGNDETPPEHTQDCSRPNDRIQPRR
jgi:hypothetical protein